LKGAREVTVEAFSNDYNGLLIRNYYNGYSMQNVYSAIGVPEGLGIYEIGRIKITVHYISADFDFEKQFSDDLASLFPADPNVWVTATFIGYKNETAWSHYPDVLDTYGEPASGISQYYEFSSNR